MNTFYHGDCKFVMSHDIEPESVDLIYLDPPFFTGKMQKGESKEATEWMPEAMPITYEDGKQFWKEKGVASYAPEWLKHIAIERPDFAAYLFYMMERLEACKKVLKSTGSIYLHCDYRASHYLKMLMDEPNLFGENNFRNEIIWHYQPGTKSKRDFGRKHDTILFYAKSGRWEFNQQRQPSLSPQSYDRVDEDGRRYLINGQGNTYYLDNGRACDDVWTWTTEREFNSLASNDKERTGYPTQKPLALLERIILASSNIGDTVLDPFCGCGTAIIAAQRHGRQWIGIDISKDAYNVSKGRYHQLSLETQIEQPESRYIERNLSEVKKIDSHAFEAWVNEFYKASRLSKDKGVDGITKDGIPIQTKAWAYKVDETVVKAFSRDIEVHPDIPQPVKQAILVSRDGFNDNARAMAFQIKAKFGVEIELKIPEDLLKIEEVSVGI